MRLRLVGVC